MKAAVVYAKSEIRIADVPRPRACEGEVVVKVRASGICATDVKILGGLGAPAELPAILGHEVAGTISELGAGAEAAGLHEGQRVAVYPIAACGHCVYCREGCNSLCLNEHGLGHGDDGGFAEYVRVPAEIVRLAAYWTSRYAFRPGGDDRTDFLLHRSRGPMQDGRGRYGRGHRRRTARYAAYNRIEGAGRAGYLRGPNDERLAAARKLGATAAIHPEREDAEAIVRERTGQGADVVIAAVGVPRVIERTCLSCAMGAYSTYSAARRGEK